MIICLPSPYPDDPVLASSDYDSTYETNHSDSSDFALTEEGGGRQAPRDPERGREAPRDPERGREAPRDAERGREAPRDPEGGREFQPEALLVPSLPSPEVGVWGLCW